MSSEGPRAEPTRGPGTAPRRIVVRCSACGTKNRIDLERAAAAAPRCARCHGTLELPARQHSVIEVTDATFPAIVETSPIPVLLEFQSRYCIHCQRLRPLMERLAEDVTDRLRVASLDLDENRATAARYRVNATPTLLVLDRGRELERIEGAVSEDQLRYRLYRYLNA